MAVLLKALALAGRAVLDFVVVGGLLAGAVCGWDYLQSLRSDWRSFRMVRQQRRRADAQQRRDAWAYRQAVRAMRGARRAAGSAATAHPAGMATGQSVVAGSGQTGQAGAGSSVCVVDSTAAADGAVNPGGDRG